MFQTGRTSTGETTQPVAFRLAKPLARKLKRIRQLPARSPIRARMKVLGYSNSVNGLLRYLLETDERLQLLLTDIDEQS